MRRGVMTVLLAGLCAAGARPGAAQQGAAEIRGRVTDPHGAVVPGAEVELRHEQTGMFRRGLSGATGTYFLGGVTPGVYVLSAEITGFKRYSRRGVRLEVGKTATVDLALEVGGPDEEMTVTAETPLVDVTSKEVGGHITSGELTDLPSLNRSFIGFVSLLPGMVPVTGAGSSAEDSVAANGQDPRNNNFMLDGGNNNDDISGQWAGPQVRIPIEAVQEFQVLTGQYDAEFSRTTGAVVNAITRQGTNAWHGSAFAFLQDASLTGKDFFARRDGLEKPDTRFQQYGLTVGGPVVKNKAHFFASVERLVSDEARTVNIPARPDLTAATTTHDRIWNTLVRFDHQLSAAHTWSVRWLREHALESNQFPGGLTRTLAAPGEADDVDQTVVAAFNSSLGNSRFNTLRLAFTAEDLVMANPGFIANGHRQDLLPPTLRYLTFADQQREAAQIKVDHAWQAEDTFDWFVPGKKGDHNVRLGAQYQYVDADLAIHGNMNGTFVFRTDGPFDAADPRSYPERLTIRVPGPTDLSLRTHSFGAFVQDKWKVNRRLTLSLGLRYDLEVIPLREDDNPAFPDPADYPVDGNNVAPRLGFAFDPHGDGRTVIRGGYGRFFDRTHYEILAAIVTAGVYSSSFIASLPAGGPDPGPSRGERPSDPFLADGPTVDRDLLAELFPPGTRVRNTGAVSLDSPERRTPRTDQLSIGGERALGPHLSVSLDYVHASGRDQLMSRDLNPGVRVDTTRTGRVVRQDPAFASSVFQLVNTGRTDYDALLLQGERRWAGSHRFRVSYTLASSRGNTDGFTLAVPPSPTSPFQYLDDMRLDANQGPTNTDVRHNLVVSGSAVVPGTGGLTVAAVVRAMSGRPFTVHDTSVDPDRNGVLFDPIPAGTYAGTGPDAGTVESEGGRNGARGPGFFQADVRLGYRFRFGERRLEVFGEVFNLTDRANFEPAAGDRRSTNFLTYTSLRAGAVPRTGQVGMRFTF